MSRTGQEQVGWEDEETVRLSARLELVGSVGLAGGRVRIGVRDADPARPRISLDAQREGGFGLRLIQNLSRDWGVAEIHGNGKRIWFELDLPDGDPDPA